MPTDPWAQFNPVAESDAKPLPNGGVYIPPSLTPSQIADDARADEQLDISRNTNERGERTEARQTQADTWTVMTPEEKQAAGLGAGTYQRNGLGEVKQISEKDSQQNEQARNASNLLLGSAGIDPVTGKDPVADLINGSTSGYLQKWFADAYGGVTGDATSGMENIAKLQTIVSDMTLQLTGGSLGAQVSNADRDFITQRIGNLADASVPASQRLAAWEEVKGRLQRQMGDAPSAMDQPSAETAPDVTGAKGAFKTPEDIALEKRLNDALAAGASLEELQAIAGNRAGVPATQEALDAARKAGSRFNVLPSGYRADDASVMGIKPESGTGAFIMSAANALTSGGLDEIVGAMGGDAAMAQAAKEAIRDKYPVSSFAGEVAGQAMQMAGATRALGALGATGRAAAVGSEVAQGAAYGAGEANDNRAVGALFGAGGAAGGRAIADRIIEPGVQAIIKKVSRDTGAPVEEVEKLVVESLEGAAPATPEATAQVSDEVTDLARQATSMGPRSRSAKRKLAEMAAIDPEAAAAAERLGVDLPPDVLSENAQLKNLTGLARSQVGSEAETGWQGTAGRAAARMQGVLEEVGATNDLAQLSENVGTRIKSTMEGLKTQADALRTEVDEVIDPKAAMDAGALRARLSQTVDELGGAEQAAEALNPLEKRLMRLIDDENPPTYAYFERIRRDIGEALEKGRGPFADIDQRTLGEYYQALKQDRLDFVRGVGGDELADKMAASNALYSQMYDARQELVDLFGKDLQGGIVPALRSALTSGNKGDIGKLNRMLANIPEDMQGEVLLSGILAESMSKTGANGGPSFANLSKLYRGLRGNTPIYKKIAKAIGPEGEQVLTDLYAVGRRIADADSRILRTGKANQAQLATLNAENLLSSVLQGTVRRGATVAGAGAGGATLGPLGSMAGAAAGETLGKTLTSGGRTRLDKLHGLLSSPQFRETVEKVATGDTSPGVLNKLANSNAFVKFARLSGLDTPEARMEWLKRAVTGSGTVAAAGAAPEGEATQTIEMVAP